MFATVKWRENRGVGKRNTKERVEAATRQNQERLTDARFAAAYMARRDELLRARGFGRSSVQRSPQATPSQAREGMVGASYCGSAAQFKTRVMQARSPRHIPNQLPDWAGNAGQPAVAPRIDAAALLPHIRGTIQDVAAHNAQSVRNPYVYTGIAGAAAACCHLAQNTALRFADPGLCHNALVYAQRLTDVALRRLTGKIESGHAAATMASLYDGKLLAQRRQICTSNNSSIPFISQSQ